MGRFFKSKGKEVFVVGGQAHNSSSYGVSLDTACEAVKKVGGNTVEVPVYWECIEPEEGIFCFDDVKEIFRQVTEYNLYLIVLWFGTWKNGTSKFAPSWVKKDKKRFARVIGENGAEIAVLSPHCVETRNADAKAFGKLMECLEKIDPKKKVLLAVQVENEPGIMNGPARDYGEEASNMYKQSLPQKIVEFFREKPNCTLSLNWAKNGSYTENWEKAFKTQSEEVFSAFAIASFVNEVAKEGRKKSNIPMYTNVWVEDHRLKLPGRDYPSGGAVERTYELWKYIADNLEFIAPDNYQQTYEGYAKCCNCYSGEGNPLFIPESGLLEWNSRYMFSAVSDFQAIGICAFGIESIWDGKEVGEKEQAVVESLQILGALGPGLIRFQDRVMKSIMQDEYAQYQYLEFEKYIGIAYFTNCNPLVGRIGTDWNWHGYKHKDYLQRQKRGGCRGRGIVIQASEKEFYVAGDGFQLVLLPTDKKSYYLDGSDFHLTRCMDFITIEEGHFDQDGMFIAENQRNGDEADFGIWVEPDVKVVKVCLC